VARITATPPADRNDGTSQRSRALAALDPTQVPIDERSSADLLAYVMAYVRQLRFHGVGADGTTVEEAGSWEDFANAAESLGLSAADMAAYSTGLQTFEGARLAWLGRPHFALLLVFVELLAHARSQLNGLAERHLDHHYRDILLMQPLLPEPDRALVLFSLAPRASAALLQAGTALDAGRDSSGVPQIYRIERDCLINHAVVAELRSVFVDRQITGIPDVRTNASLPLNETINGMLRLALGEPGPDDPVPAWRGNTIDNAWLVDPHPQTGLRAVLALCRSDRGLFLAHYELRALMRLLQRRNAGLEWQRINMLLGNDAPAQPRDFAANFAAAIAPEVLDFDNDGLPQVASIDDLFAHQAEPDVRLYIAAKLKNLGPPGADPLDNFVTLMPLKQAIDRDWASINLQLESMAQRRLGNPQWQFPATNFDPTSFDRNVATALGDPGPAWPWGTTSLQTFEERLRELEVQLGMPVERLDELAALVATLPEQQPDAPAWEPIDQMLAGAHRERTYTRRRETLDELRVGASSAAAFDAVVLRVLATQRQPGQPALAWEASRALLGSAGRLPDSALNALHDFRASLGDPEAPQSLSWPEAIQLLELAWRNVERLPEPVALYVRWRNLYAWPDARAATSDPGSSRWTTFGRRPESDAAAPAPAPVLGWALSAPLLHLAEGTRKITVTIGLEPASFVLSTFLADLGIDEAADIRAAIADAWIIQLSGVKGWIEPELGPVRISRDVQSGGDYWSFDDVARPDGSGDRPALQLVLHLGPERDPVAAAPGMDVPRLRVMLRPKRDQLTGEWTTLAQPFEPLRVAAIRISTEVIGLRGLQLQHDDRKLDARKPFEPFGSEPAPDAVFYLSHPELVRERLNGVTFKVDWSGLPGDPMHYANYAPEGAPANYIKDFKLDATLIDHNLDLLLDSLKVPFGPDATSSLALLTLPDLLTKKYPGFNYVRWPDLAPSADLRNAGRCWRLDLSTDLGHRAYGTVAARWAANLAVDIAGGRVPSGHPVSYYQVNPPYTPLLRRLSVDYMASVELQPGQPDSPGQLLHQHPFGEAVVGAEQPSLLPIYETAGELYIGLRGLKAPQQATLLVQLAEGTSNPDLDPATVHWACLDGDAWRAVEVIADATRDLLNSGIVELALPAVAPSNLLPGGLYWLRAAVGRSAASVCNCVDIHAQAARVRFDDQGNAATHYAQPLPVGSITRLANADARITAMQQPYTSFGGRAPEPPQQFRIRVSERLRHRQRALAPWDVERLVLQRFGQIYKAKCLPAEPAPGTLTVIVIPDIRRALPSDALAPKAPANLLADIRGHIAERAPAGARVLVRNARFVPVRLRLSVRFLAGQDETYAVTRLNDDLVRFLAPWAYDDAAELMIGSRIYANSVIDFVDRRDYVDYVGDIKLFRVRSNGSTEYVLPPADDADGYHIATERPDEVLVAARAHDIDIIPPAGYQQATYTGIDYMKIELDFVVHA